jgi:hypothetical protein
MRLGGRRRCRARAASRQSLPPLCGRARHPRHGLHWPRSCRVYIRLQACAMSMLWLRLGRRTTRRPCVDFRAPARASEGRSSMATLCRRTQDSTTGTRLLDSITVWSSSRKHLHAGGPRCGPWCAPPPCGTLRRPRGQAADDAEAAASFRRRQRARSPGCAGRGPGRRRLQAGRRRRRRRAQDLRHARRARAHQARRRRRPRRPRLRTPTVGIGWRRMGDSPRSDYAAVGSGSLTRGFLQRARHLAERERGEDPFGLSSLRHDERQPSRRQRAARPLVPGPWSLALHPSRCGRRGQTRRSRLGYASSPSRARFDPAMPVHASGFATLCRIGSILEITPIARRTEPSSLSTKRAKPLG